MAQKDAHFLENENIYYRLIVNEENGGPIKYLSVIQIQIFTKKVLIIKICNTMPTVAAKLKFFVKTIGNSAW